MRLLKKKGEYEINKLVVVDIWSHFSKQFDKLKFKMKFNIYH